MNIKNKEAMDSLAEAKRMAQILGSSLPKAIEIAALSLKSKLPFKALSLRELLIHRGSALANAAVDLFEEDRLIPDFVLTRAFIETLAVLYNLNKQINLFLEKKNIGELDNFLMCCLMGSRNNPDLPEPKQILNLIDKLNKTIPGFRSIFDSLCEYAHPNWAGTFGAFGEIDRESFILKLGPTDKTDGLATGLSALCGALLAFQFYYNECADSILGLNDYFEKPS